jgi:hypothetical protein
MKTRCKFKCLSITRRKQSVYKDGRSEVKEVNDAELFAVGAEDGPENKAFFESTPGGMLHVSTIRADVFELGKSYYLDITDAD